MCICLFFLCTLFIACYSGIISTLFICSPPWLIILMWAVSIHNILLLALLNQKCSQGINKNNVLFLVYSPSFTCTVFQCKDRFKVSLRFLKAKRTYGNLWEDLIFLLNEDAKRSKASIPNSLIPKETITQEERNTVHLKSAFVSLGLFSQTWF